MGIRKVTELSATNIAKELGYRSTHEMKDDFYVGRSEYDTALNEYREVIFVATHPGTRPDKKTGLKIPPNVKIDFK